MTWGTLRPSKVPVRLNARGGQRANTERLAPAGKALSSPSPLLLLSCNSGGGDPLPAQAVVSSGEVQAQTQAHSGPSDCVLHVLSQAGLFDRIYAESRPPPLECIYLRPFVTFQEKFMLDLFYILDTLR